MDSLPASAAWLIASQVGVDERDAAALRSTCRFWRDIFADQALWEQLLERRFGAVAAASQAGQQGGSREASAAAAAAAAAVAPVCPEEQFKQLASLRKPVSSLERLIWLDGQHLQVVTEPGSTFECAVKVHSVCWLELGGRFAGVLPGRYRVAWRCRLQGNFMIDHARLIVRQEPARGAAGSGSEDDDAGEGEGQGGGGVQAETGISWSQMRRIFQEVGSTWFELVGEPFEVSHPCSVWVEFRAISDTWKHGLIFDSVHLRRQPLPVAALGPALAPVPAQHSRQAWLAGQARGVVGWLSRALGGTSARPTAGAE